MRPFLLMYFVALSAACTPSKQIVDNEERADDSYASADGGQSFGYCPTDDGAGCHGGVDTNLDGVIDERDIVELQGTVELSKETLNARIEYLDCKCFSNECERLRAFADESDEGEILIPAKINARVLGAGERTFSEYIIETNLPTDLKPLVSDGVQLVADTSEDGFAGRYLFSFGSDSENAVHLLRYDMYEGQRYPLSFNLDVLVFNAQSGQNCELILMATHSN